MKAKVSNLREVLELLQPVVPKKHSIPVMSTVLVNNGRVVGTDAETMVVIEAPNLEGRYLLPYREALDQLKSIPGYETIDITPTGEGIDITWTSGSVHLNLEPNPDDFPPITDLKEPTEGKLNGDQLVAAMKEAIRYATTEETRPVLTGVSLLLGEQVVVAGADGFRMYYHPLPESFPAELTAIVPAKAVTVLSHLWAKAPPGPDNGDDIVSKVIARRALRLGVMDSKAKFSFGDVHVITTLVGGTPPKFGQLIPKEVKTTIKVYASDLERAVQKVRKIFKSAHGRIALTWTESQLTVAATEEDVGTVRDEIPVEASEPGQAFINSLYLSSYLKGKSNLVTIGVNSATEPLVFHDKPGPTVLIMPMMGN